MYDNRNFTSTKEKENSKNHMVIAGKNTGITPVEMQLYASTLGSVTKNKKGYEKKGTKNPNSRKAMKVSLRKEW